VFIESQKSIKQQFKMRKIGVPDGVSLDGVFDAQTMGQSNIVQAQGITKMFGKTRVLEDINLNVPQGSVLALLGPNGAGKTTPPLEF
jgi:ATPase subunit of ABC transporter with duplicated ATPase domains